MPGIHMKVTFLFRGEILSFWQCMADDIHGWFVSVIHNDVSSFRCFNLWNNVTETDTLLMIVANTLLKEKLSSFFIVLFFWSEKKQ